MMRYNIESKMYNKYIGVTKFFYSITNVESLNNILPGFDETIDVDYVYKFCLMLKEKLIIYRNTKRIYKEVEFIVL